MKKIFLNLIALIALVGCTDPNEGSLFITPTDDESEMAITDVLEMNANEYSLWIELLKYTDFYNALRDGSARANTAAKSTVFCPNNAAMRKFLAGRGVSRVEELPLKYAKEVVQVHIMPGTTISETQLSDYAKEHTTLTTPTLFGTMLTLQYGHTVTDVDDADRSDEQFNTDSIYINNQARLDKFTAISTINGTIFSMGDVIRPLSETILEKLDLESSEYSIFADAIRSCGYDSIANLVTDTTYAVGGQRVVTYHYYTCLAPTNEAFRHEGINDVSGLKQWLVNHSKGYETDGDAALLSYIRYHFTPRQYEVSDLFNFQEEGQTLIFDTNFTGKAIMTNNINGVNIINKTAAILRSDIPARNGLINKIDHVLPVEYDPEPVAVTWDFLNSADIISFVNNYGVSNSLGNLFSSPLASSERQIDLAYDETNFDARYGTLSSFTYQAKETRASTSRYRRVGFYKDKYAKATDKETSVYGAYMNNYMVLNLGYTGWIKFTTPAIIAGRYKVVLHYCKDVTIRTLATTGTNVRFEIDEDQRIVNLYKGVTFTATDMYGMVETTIWPTITFDGSGQHTFKITLMDTKSKDNSSYHLMLDYVEFVPIN